MIDVLSGVTTVLFDLDGVLVDSSAANTASFHALVKKAGYETISDEAHQECFHLPLERTLENLFGIEDPKEIARVKAMTLDNDVWRSDLFVFPECLAPKLEKLKARYKLGVVTSRLSIEVPYVLAAGGITGMFDVIVGHGDYERAKPDPEPLQVALKRLGGTAASRSVYIGDSPTDIDAAHAAGMRSIFLSPHEHEHATLRIDTLDDLKNVLL